MSKRNGVNRVCKCGNEFYVQGFRINDSKRGKFCSIQCYRKASIGIRKSILTEFKKGDNLGENHPFWTKNVKYYPLHSWILRSWGKASECINGHDALRYEWANMTGIYDRNKENWRQMCISCHRKEDLHNPKRPIYG